MKTTLRYLYPLTALLLVACGGSTRTYSHASVIPWVNRPAIVEATNVAGTSASTCAPGQLALESGRQGALHGMATQELLIRNMGSNACSVRAPLTISVSGKPGRSALAAGTADQQFTLPAGGSLTAVIGTPGACSGSDPSKASPHTMATLDLPSGSVGPANIYLDAQCGAASVVTLIPSDTSTKPADSPLAGLVLSITAPTTVNRGHLLTYTLHLSNPTAVTIVLDPCPNYTEILNAGGVVVSSSYQLNCAAAGPIEPGKSQDFAMQMAVPSNASIGSAKLGWKFDNANNGAGTVINVH